MLSLVGLLVAAPFSAHASGRDLENLDPKVAAILPAYDPRGGDAATVDRVVKDVEDVIAGLSADDPRARDLAERALAPFLRDPRTLGEALALAAASASPEARQRLARAVVQDGRTFCALTIATRSLSAAARGGESAAAAAREAAAATRLLRLSMEAALAVEGPPLLMRGELGDRPYVFREGLVTGVRVPLGPGIPFGTWVRWMTLCLPAARPLMVDARLDLGSIAAVDLKELLPTTADAFLKRVLTARDLGVIDLGVAFVIATRKDVESTEARFATALEKPAPEGEDDAEARRRERRLLDRARADWLVERLLDPDIDGSRLARLLQAVAPVGSRAALALVEEAGVDGVAGLVPGVDEAAARGVVLDVAEFGVVPTLDLLRLGSTSPGARVTEVQQIAFFDLVRRPESAGVIVLTLLDHPDRSTLRFACRLAAELRQTSAMESLGRIARGESGEDLTPAERCDAALAMFEIAPLDPAVRALLTQTIRAGVSPDLLRHATEAALIMVRTDPRGEAAAAFALGNDWLASDAAGASTVGAAVAALAVGRGGVEGETLAAFTEIVSTAGTPGAEAWLLARAGSPLADESLDADVVVAGLALDVAPAVDILLRAHALRDQKAPIAEQLAAAEEAGANAMAAIVLEAIRDLVHDGFRASFVKAAIGRSSELPGKAAMVAELAEVLRATNAGAEILWLDPRRCPPP